jgi:hypothetical protein
MVAVVLPILPNPVFAAVTHPTPPPVPVVTVLSMRSVISVRFAFVALPRTAVEAASRSKAAARTTSVFAVSVVTAGNISEVVFVVG